MQLPTDISVDDILLLDDGVLLCKLLTLPVIELSATLLSRAFSPITKVYIAKGRLIRCCANGERPS
jgi:hypothetical protein